jgi:hypothetical protein
MFVQAKNFGVTSSYLRNYTAGIIHKKLAIKRMRVTQGIRVRSLLLTFSYPAVTRLMNTGNWETSKYKT